MDAKPKDIRDMTVVKNTVRIAAYGMWFCAWLLLSCLKGWPLLLANWLVREIHPPWFFQIPIKMTVALGVWFGFLFLFSCLPVWWMRRRHSPALRLIARCATFLLAMLLCTVFCTILWQNFVTDKLYNCTDPAWLDFLSPGDWVHDWDHHHPIAVVAKVVTGRSMEEPDEIKAGWSVTRLWWLWCSWVAASMLASYLVSRWLWPPGRPRSLPGEPAT
jgi:hypothetical protein